MGVYRPAKSRFYHYDFTISGSRFHGSTGQETRRGAEAFERRCRLEAAEGRLGNAAQATVDKAAARWWNEVGSRRGDCDTVEHRLETLVRLLGPNRKLCDIDGSVVSAAVTKRRSETFTRSPKKGAKRYPISDSSVNRDVIETLRPIMRRAALHWGAKGLHAIDWKEYRLGEPAPVVRLYTDQQQARWLEEAHASCEAAGAALNLLLTYGLRFEELFFNLDWHRPDAHELILPGHARKRDVWNVLPLREADSRDLAARIGRARAAELVVAWFYEDDRGELIALTYGGLEARLQAAAKRAGITEDRVIHGARHHAGTTLLRKTGNLALVKKLLGHENIQSTMRYAQALTDDLRAALDADQPRNSTGAETSDGRKAS